MTNTEHREVDQIRRITIELLRLKFNIPREDIEEAESIAAEIIYDDDG